MMKKYLFRLKVTLITFLAVVFAFGFMERDKNGKGGGSSSEPVRMSKTNATGFVGNSYRMNVNNINLPLNSRGVLAAVNIPPDGTLGYFKGLDFLFSSGFFMSGYSNGNLWANAQATASLVDNYLPGTVDGRDGGMWVVNVDDPPFGESWQAWKGAVDLGADFYDGNGDGAYNPVDLNGNGIWDPEEDHPDLLGSETVWTVFNDGVPSAQRGGQNRFEGVEPQGIEIRQTVFAFAAKGSLGNIIFIRYRLKNSGVVADTLKDVIFGVWADPDIGDSSDDLVGSDVGRNAGYVYNDAEDENFSDVPPAFLIDFFSGPVSYIPGETYTDNNGNGQYDEGTDTAIDTAYSFRGQLIGFETYPGAKNLGISSFTHYIQSDPGHGDPDTKEEARNYMEGNDRLGSPIDPCAWTWGEVFGEPCAAVDPTFLYSGDPITRQGWLNTTPTDQRQLSNTGPFDMPVGEEIEIVVAYVVGQGTSALNSIEVAKKIDDGAQFIFDQNFRSPTPPPAVDLKVEAGEDFIDLVWETPDQLAYLNQTVAWDLRFEGFNVYAFKTNSPSDEIAGVENSKLIASYDLDNFINNVYKESAETGGIEPLYDESEDKLDYNVFTTPETGKIRLRIKNDPFTGGDLIKGKPYYFAVTSYALNYDALIPMKDDASFGDNGDYYLSAAAFTGESENVVKPQKIVMGSDIYNPPIEEILVSGPENHVAGASDGQISYDVVNRAELTGDIYEVTFEIDSTAKNYDTFWSLKNTTTGNVLIDSSKEFLFEQATIAVPTTDGFITKVEKVEPALGPLMFESDQEWMSAENVKSFYLATDMGTQSTKLANLPGNISGKANSYIRADKLRRVEIRFDESGKAYRYLQGYIGNIITKNNNYIYAEGVTESNPQFTGDINEIGKVGEGFVDVPFTAWIDDPEYGETRQLAVGFVEAKAGNPDGVWNPGTDVTLSSEYILVFNSDYDPEGNQQVYKGFQGDDGMVWAKLGGYDIPDAANATQDQKNIAASPYYNTLYGLGLSKDAEETDVTGKVIVPVETYPYSPADVYTFETRMGGELTDEEEGTLWEKVTVYPNPLFGYNPATSYTNANPDDPFVTFSNLPTDITIKIFSLSGQLLRTLTSEDKDSRTSPFLRWDLKNESGLRVASGMYLAIVDSPDYGEKVLKFAIIMPQKQLPKY